MALQAFKPIAPMGRGDRFPPRDNINKPLILRYVGQSRIKSQYSEKATKWVSDDNGGRREVPNLDVRENGARAVHVDIVDVNAGVVFRNVAWMTEALTDYLRRTIEQNKIQPGTVLGVMRLVSQKGTNNSYIVPEPGTEADVAAANAYEQRVGDVWAANTEAAAPAPSADEEDFAALA